MMNRIYKMNTPVHPVILSNSLNMLYSNVLKVFPDCK